MDPDPRYGIGTGTLPVPPGFGSGFGRKKTKIYQKVI